MPKTDKQGEEIRKAVGKKILEFRKLARFSQLELAQATGHDSAAYISFIEKGQRNITVVDLILIANVLRIPVEYFLAPPPCK